MAVSEMVRPVWDLVLRDIGGQTEDLDTGQQHEFWTQLNRYARGRQENENPELIVGEVLSVEVRYRLEALDMKIRRHMAELSDADQRQVWSEMESYSAGQAEQTKQPKARISGHRQSSSGPNS